VREDFRKQNAVIFVSFVDGLDDGWIACGFLLKGGDKVSTEREGPKERLGDCEDRILELTV
jgi:hypothetical protein